jgi:gamma-glutamyl-gamma-aminobutyrate hydrolase PuuD
VGGLYVYAESLRRKEDNMPYKVFVAAGEEWNAAYMNSVRFLGLEVTDSVRDFHAFPEEFRLVVFTGGADVTPSIYGHKRNKRLTYNSEMRDYHEKHIFMTALEFSMPMVGICRGLQWLNCMAGGFMIQHVDRHNAGDHNVDTYTGDMIGVNSLHHQMCVPPDDGYILAVSKAQRSQRYIYNNREKFHNPTEVESCYYPNINAFGVQWHPEGYGCPKAGVNFWEYHVALLFDGGLYDRVVEHNPPKFPQFLDEKITELKYKRRYSQVLRQNSFRAEEAK